MSNKQISAQIELIQIGVSLHISIYTVYPKKYAHGFCFAVFCCGYTLTDFPLSIRLTSLALWQSNDCPSASKATLINMDKYFMWIHYERLHNHNKAKHNKTVCIFLGIYCMYRLQGDAKIHIGHHEWMKVVVRQFMPSIEVGSLEYTQHRRILILYILVTVTTKYHFCLTL